MVSDIEQIPKDNHNYDISEPEQEVEEEMVFINVYPDKRKFDENPQNQEKAKKAGFLNHWKEEKQDSFVIEEKKKLDDEEIAKIDKEEKKKKGGAPKLPFVNHIKEINDVEEQHEVKEVSEEENSKFRYSKMDEKQAEILYKERFV